MILSSLPILGYETGCLSSMARKEKKITDINIYNVGEYLDRSTRSSSPFSRRTVPLYITRFYSPSFAGSSSGVESSLPSFKFCYWPSLLIYRCHCHVARSNRNWFLTHFLFVVVMHPKSSAELSKAFFQYWCGTHSWYNFTLSQISTVSSVCLKVQAKLNSLFSIIMFLMR